MGFMNTIRARLAGYPLTRQILKFCIVGGTSAVINFSVYYTFTHLGVWYVVSAAWAYAVAAIFNFIANKFWTFRSNHRGRVALRQLHKFFIVNLSGLLLNTLLIYLFTDLVGWDYRLSWVGATGLVTFWNFGFNRSWTFRHAQLPAKPE